MYVFRTLKYASNLLFQSNQLQLGQKRSALALTNGVSDGNEGPYKMVRSNDYVTESVPKIAPESPLTSALRSTRGTVSLEDDDYGNSNSYFLKASSGDLSFLDEI